MKRLTETALSKLLYRAGVVLAVAAVAALVYLTRLPDTWSDEAFTLALVRKPLFDILRLTASDVHPPLYYVLLKAFLIVTKPFLPVVPAAKLFSVLPLVGISVLTATRVRQMYGRAAAGLFLMLLHAVPSPVAYALEIRMYSLAAFFVFGGFLSAASYLQDHEERRLKGLAVWTLAASYTHYYACIAMAAAFLWILADALRRGGVTGNDSERHSRRNAAWKAAGLTIVLYLPWIIVLMGQLKTLSGGYWIDPITRYTLRLYARFAFGMRGVMWVLLLLIAISAVVRLPHRKASLLCLSGIALVFLIGVGVSVLFRPVFVDRYLLPALPAALLGCTVFIAAPAPASSGMKPAVGRARLILILAGSLFFLITAVTVLRARIGEEREVNALFAPTLDFAQTLREDDIVITTNRHINEEMAFLSPARCCVIGEEEPALMKEVFGNVETIPQPDTTQAGTAAASGAIATLLTQSGTVCFLDYEVAPYPGVEEVLRDEDIAYEKTSEIFIEGPVTAYKVYPKVDSKITGFVVK